MEGLGKQADRKSRRRSVRTFPGVWEYKTLKESASEELKYILEIITGGHPPGRSVTDGQETTND